MVDTGLGRLVTGWELVVYELLPGEEFILEEGRVGRGGLLPPAPTVRSNAPSPAYFTV